MKRPDWKIWMKDEEECKNWLDTYIKKEIIRKSENNSKLHLRKTDHNLNLANWILEKHKDEIPQYFGKDTFYDWIIDIYYYAIYHSALALMSKEKYSSKNHAATLCFLIYFHYHQKKIFDKEEVEFMAGSLNKEDIEIVGMSKELREKASYDVHELFERKLAEQIKEQTVDFVNKIKRLIEE